MTTLNRAALQAAVDRLETMRTAIDWQARATAGTDEQRAEAFRLAPHLQGEWSDAVDAALPLLIAAAYAVLGQEAPSEEEARQKADDHAPFFPTGFVIGYIAGANSRLLLPPEEG